MRRKREIIYLIGFIFSLPIALTSYINSSFVSSFIGEKSVGAIYAAGSIVSIIALLVVPQIFRKVGGYKFLLSVIALDSFAVLLFAFSKDVWSVILLFILSFTFNVLIYFSLDELLKIFSKDSATGKIRGAYLTLCSLAWVLAQFALGTFWGEFSFKMIYLTSFAFMLLFFAIACVYLRDVENPAYDKSNIKKYVKEFFNNKNLFRAYGISSLLQFFYCWMVIYTPIYLSSHMGFSWKEISIIFTVMLLPFLIIPFNLGKYADKIGERKILMFGFTLVSLATLSLFFIHGHILWIWAVLLFATRTGASMIEVTSDAYFFKHIRPENEEFLGVYRSASPVAYIIGPIFASLVFIFIPSFKLIYIILGIIMLCGVYLSSTIRRNDI